jgi:hypothetical protein
MPQLRLLHALPLIALLLAPAAAFADSRRDSHSHRRDSAAHGRHDPGPRAHWQHRRDRSHEFRHRDAPRRVVVVPRHRAPHFGGGVVRRPHGHWYQGYGFHRSDRDAYRWLGLAAITLGVLDFLDEQQQRAHEAAQIGATAARLGETVVWRDGNAAGGVTALREGTSASGAYCREFRQTVTIGGRTEEAYGTACRAPDGAWRLLD